MGNNTPADEHTDSMNDLRRRLSNISDGLAEQYRISSNKRANNVLLYTEGFDGRWGLYWCQIDEEGTHLTPMVLLSDEQALSACASLAFVNRCLISAQEDFNKRKVIAEKHLSTFVDILESVSVSGEQPA